MTQPSFADVLRDDGAEAALANSDDWAELAWQALLDLAASGVPFTSETLRKRAGDPPVPNAVGAIFLRASKQRRIVKTGRARNGTRPQSHATSLPEWIGVNP